MSEIINNREYRQKALKELIRELHAGKSVAEVQEKFRKLIEGVTPAEISEMEQNLIMEGLPVGEVQRLCDVHAAVFKGSIEEIHHPETVPGHPIHTFKLENRALEELIDGKVKPHTEAFRADDRQGNVLSLLEDINLLWDIDKHYSRKENLLFPYLEKAGITAPPKVMWGVDDEVRAALKEIRQQLSDYQGGGMALADQIEAVAEKIKEMIFKEESILFPMALETLSEGEWFGIEEGSDEIGYCLTQPEAKWQQSRRAESVEKREEMAEDAGVVRFATGFLTPAEISAIFNHLPVDITFVDKKDKVKYFSQGQERIFARTRAVIGRDVQNCHPPASVGIVEKIVADFKAGKKEQEGFWLRIGEAYVHIRYFAVRNEAGEYMGTLEVTQNIAPIQAIRGEKRLVEE
ncbi:MAG: DUF438 domain-containing protein [bacterium]|jgi:DUF438 domain-containing protein